MSNMRRLQLAVCIGATFLGSCSANQVTPLPTEEAFDSARHVFAIQNIATESVLYVFKGAPDGEEPFAGLLAGGDGEFFGTTNGGGVTGPSGYTGGTVFEVSSKGKERVIYSFKGGSDGTGSEAGVIADSKGNLYGATDYGGGATACPYGGCGTVYELTPKGDSYTETVLYAFQGGKDGAFPLGSLLMVDGVLYGTTTAGGGSKTCATSSGVSGCGTVFSLTSSGSTWSERILHAFKGGKDGAAPRGSLIADSSGALYGTTEYGGGSTGCDPTLYGTGTCGTAFSVSTSGTERVLYRFKGGSDGEDPRSALLAGKNGAFYGLTLLGGGATECGSYGCGTAYELIPKAKGYTEKIIHAFGFGSGSQDGVYPYDPEGLIADSSGNLYGTTNNSAKGYGSIFQMTLSGGSFSYAVLHDFTAGSDGAYPHGGVVLSSGSLYGTTFLGGGTCAGSSGSCGTVYKVKL